MKRYFFIITALFLGSLSFAQPSLDERYFFGRNINFFGSVIATDSCYYTLGTAMNDTIANHFDLCFTKFDHWGNIMDQNFVHSDSSSMYFTAYPILIETLDSNFICLGTIEQYSTVVKLNHHGDTLFMKNIDFLVSENLIATDGRGIMQLEADSSYTCLIGVYDQNTFENSAIVFNVSKTGGLNFYKVYNSPLPGYTDLIPGSFLKLDNSGYLIASYVYKPGTIENSRFRLLLIKTDSVGNVVESYLELNNNYIMDPRSLTPTPDGGWIYCGEKGVYASNPTIWRKNYICKLKNDYTIDWEIEWGDSTNSNFYIGLEDLKAISDSEFVACGRHWSDSLVEGVLIKFDMDGNVIWDSYFQVPDIYAFPNWPRHIFRDIEQTPDGGFVMVGNADDIESISQGNPGQAGWLVKVDSNGCLQSDCQDFVGTPEYFVAENIAFKTYPNPVDEQLKVSFSQPLKYPVQLMLTDMEGRIIYVQKNFSGSIISIHVADLKPGVYVLNVKGLRTNISRRVVIQ